MTATFVGERSDGAGLTSNDADRVLGDGAKVVSVVHGKHVESSIRGRVYTGSSASAGIAIKVAGTGGGHPTLWNPADSGVYLSLIALRLGYVSGANAPTSMGFATVPGNAGSTHATGAPIATATRVDPTGVIGGTLSNKGIWSPTTNTFTVAPVFERSVGLSLFTGLAATATTPFTMQALFDGDLVIAPGKAICLTTQAATTTALFQVSLTWEEIDQ